MHVKVHFFSLTVLSVFLASLVPAPAIGQVHTSHDGVVRVETDSGSGTGFVVASENGSIETWTNGHVTRGVGSTVRLRFGTGTANESVTEGIVADRRFSGGYDWSKIVARKTYTGHVFSPNDSGGDGKALVTGGYPNGDRFYSLVLDREQSHGFNSVKAYSPPSIPGQSGSPVVDSSGMVVGVVTMYFRSGRKKYGGFLPISDWTGSSRVSTRNVGEFKTLGNAPCVK